MGLPASGNYALHIAELRKKLPDDFHIFIQKPFVVIGNEPKAAVRQRAQGTVRWASDGLKQLYFDRDPDHIINIWMLKDRKSYHKTIQQLYDHRPATEFGYYSPRHRALFMNISTGNGTLVHEMVHAYMRANFPHCPLWFNEGMAALYEQCNERDGEMKAQTNQRLPQLHKVITARRMPPFESLCNKVGRDFYEGDKFVNYAQARYLCYYLEKHGLLQKFYQEFRAAAPRDPTGYQTLQRVLGAKDMGKFQREWEYYILTLRF